uniref:Uncharacterized protein n=1 Tax=Ananas comosus var. bracteatus TaxID=296719 RepID=A0A6V7QHH4_ANACO|nr:unnamed protein product [Ananas comosus var. bracteatus]
MRVLELQSWREEENKKREKKKKTEEKKKCIILLLLPCKTPNPNPNPNPSSRSFGLALALCLRLRSLLPLRPSPLLPLSGLARAADLLASTLAAAAPLLSRSSDPAALAAHFHSGLSLLDAANSPPPPSTSSSAAASSSASSSPAPDSLRRAIAEWNRPPRFRPDLHRPHARAPRAAASAAGRAIYAAEAVAALVLGSLAAALGFGARSAPPLPRVPAEFPWAAEFNKLAEETPLKLGAGFAGEAEAVADAVKRLTTVVDGDDDPEKLRRAVEEVDKLTEEMTEGLNCLSNAVNGLFRAAMLTRNSALDTFRIGPQKCR